MTATPENAALPIIDFSRLVVSRTSAGDDDDTAAAQTSAQERSKLFAALRDIGFVYLQHHSIPASSEAALFSHARRFFALPESEKAKVETGPNKFFHGWFSPQRTSQAAAHSDQKEAFDIGDDSNASRPNQWPADWPEFRADMADFFDRCHALHLDLLGALAIEVGMPRDFFVPYVRAKDHFFRVLYYPETTGESFKDRLRAGTHTDYGTLTLLFNDNSGGLQVRNKAGQFVDAPPIPGAIIVNVGDLLSRWFNDTLCSTEHRVIEPATANKAAGDGPLVIPTRYAIAWFGQPNRDALIEPIRTCCTEANPSKYEPVYAGKHVTDRLAKLHKEGRNEEWTDGRRTATVEA